MRLFVDHRNGLTRYRMRATMSFENVIKAWRLLIRPCHVKNIPFSTALIAGWVHRYLVDRGPQTEALQEHQSVENAKGSPTCLTYAQKYNPSRKLERKKSNRSTQKSSLFTRTARGCGSSARAQRHNAASFTGNIRNKCSIDAKSIKLATK